MRRIRMALGTRALIVAALSLCSAAACSDAVEPDGQLSPDGVTFEREVYPVLLRDCAFSTCHGDASRFFRVVGPGRVRLDPQTRGDAPLTLAEVTYSYERARDMLASAPRPQDSLLVRKPLEPEAGGQGHLGLDDFGRNVYRSQADPGYQALLRWAGSRGQPPTGSALADTLRINAGQVEP